MILAVMKVYLNDFFRNRGVIVASVMTPLLMFGISCAMTIIAISEEIVQMIVKSQFFPVSMMLIVLFASLSTGITTIVEKTETGTFLLLQRTDLSWKALFCGMLLGNLFVLNLFEIIFVTLFRTVIHISINQIIIIILFSNIVDICLYPISFLLSSYFKSSKSASAILTPVTLVLMFSVTFPLMFSIIAGNPAQKYYPFICWNPMFIFNDIMISTLGIVDTPWLPYWSYVMILCIVFIVLLTLTIRTSYKYKLK